MNIFNGIGKFISSAINFCRPKNLKKFILNRGLKQICFQYWAYLVSLFIMLPLTVGLIAHTTIRNSGWDAYSGSPWPTGRSTAVSVQAEERDYPESEPADPSVIPGIWVAVEVEDEYAGVTYSVEEYEDKIGNVFDFSYEFSEDGRSLIRFNGRGLLGTYQVSGSDILNNAGMADDDISGVPITLRDGRLYTKQNGDIVALDKWANADGTFPAVTS